MTGQVRALVVALGLIALPLATTADTTSNSSKDPETSVQPAPDSESIKEPILWYHLWFTVPEPSEETDEKSTDFSGCRPESSRAGDVARLNLPVQLAQLKGMDAPD